MLFVTGICSTCSHIFSVQSLTTIIIMSEVAINLNHIAENQPSLCIPRVFNNITESRIRKVFDDLNIGNISRIDIIERGGEKGDSFKRVYVHFEKWFWNTDAQTARIKLLAGKEIKIVYDNPWFWKVSAIRNQSNKSVSQRSKPHIEFDNDPMDQLVDQFGRCMEIRNEFNDFQKRQSDNRISENRRPREDIRRPREDIRRPREDNRRPREHDNRRPREDNRRPREHDNRIPREDIRRPREDNRRPREHDNRRLKEAQHPASSRGYDARAPVEEKVFEPVTPPGPPPRRYEEVEEEPVNTYSSFHDVDAPQPEPVVLDYGKVLPVPIKKKKAVKKELGIEVKEEKDSDYLYEDIV